jgi:gluconolactonase
VKKLKHIEVPEKTANLCFGGRDGKTLFITTQPAVYIIRMNAGEKDRISFMGGG